MIFVVSPSHLNHAGIVFLGFVYSRQEHTTTFFMPASSAAAIILAITSDKTFWVFLFLPTESRRRSGNVKYTDYSFATAYYPACLGKSAIDSVALKNI